MPMISEIMDESGKGSEETSLQVSSTSPEVISGRAMHVRKVSSGKSSNKTSRSSSSGSSKVVHVAPRPKPRAFTPTGSHRNKGRPGLPMERQSSQGSSEHSESPLPLAQVSHRGIGSIVPADVDMGAQPSASVNVQNIEQNYYDQRNLSVTVGADPQRVLEHVHSVESLAQTIVRETQRQADQVVHETRSHAQQYVHEIQSQAAHVVQETQKDAEIAVQQAQSQAASVEDRANKVIEGSLEVKLPTVWTDEKQSREEAERRERLEERRVRIKKMQMREKVGKSRNTVFFQ